MAENKENDSEYQLMLQLEQLESLREEMAELGVRSIEDIDAKLEELHHRLDQMDEEDK
jgi:hypothetical protein